ncbi:MULTISPECIES: ABC transporter ATP-binding protein [Kitasatospora]|uniref:Putative ABC transporter ATP-binding protein n=1 Tax=Kitasatospora setae (strain ATCC 33774 / DSM 43861 / JCM 3304 / KCC A-0304 / NBRC 14216 / KM-6054) TaxID=452652 RepID=E4NBL0_KITSK|nr:ABC transporter ATP-binding protein [Kitasatospora setae]BAJ28591.1 putative ABC transporter ATP-binding protein [Kitasatospora setae KM-6054]
MIEARGVGRRYRRRWALRDCALEVPAGRTVGLVGPNGAGKSTLLHLLTGLLPPSAGELRVWGERPGSSAGWLARVGFVGQDAPVHRALTVREHLVFGRRANRRWDAGWAERRVAELGLDPGQRAGRLSGGQRAQLALTLALAKRPDLLVLDEPVAALDPLARREFLDRLAAARAEHGPSVLLSSHLIGDLARDCDHLIVLGRGRVRAAGPLPELLAGPDGRVRELEDVVLEQLQLDRDERAEERS